MHSTRAGAPVASPRVRVGCDLQRVAEVSESVALFGARYLHRVFTPVERALCTGSHSAERFAGRWAAKEAVAKVLRAPRSAPLPWSSIEIGAEESGAPTVSLLGPAAELAAQAGLSHIDVSITHDGGFALAFAAAIEEEGCAA
ncbi:MAG: holo-ACP synthase [Rhodoglobus sp.]